VSTTTRTMMVLFSLVPACSEANPNAVAEASGTADTSSTDGGSSLSAPPTTSDPTSLSTTIDSTETSTETSPDATIATADDESTGDAGPICGDGTVEQDEACDDGINDGSYDGCMPGCAALGPHCGDGIEQGVEVCDDGDQTNGNGCNIDCVVSGSVRWTETIDTVTEVRGLAILPDDDEFIAVGPEGSDAWIRRYTADGGVVWTTMYSGPGGDEADAQAVATDTDGNVYAAGNYGGYGSQGNGWVQKYDGDGSAGYVHTFDSVVNSSVDYISGVTVNDEGYAVVVGQADPDTQDIWVRRLGQNGSEFWTRTYDGGGSDYAAAVALDSGGNIIVVGTTSTDAWIRKYNSDGGTLWTEIEQGSPYAYPSGVATDSMDRIVIVGILDSDIWVQQRDPDGNTLWTDTFSAEAEIASGTAIATDSDDNIVVVGHISKPGGRDMWVRKYDADGEELWTQEGQLGVQAPYDDTFAWAVAIDAQQNVIVGGREALDEDGSSYAWIRKYAP